MSPVSKFQFTVRRLAVAVAIVAILLTAAIMVRRSREFARRAAFHATEEAQRKFVLEAFVPDVAECLEQEGKALELARASDNSFPDPFWMEQAAISRREAEESRAHQRSSSPA